MLGDLKAFLEKKTELTENMCSFLKYNKSIINMLPYNSQFSCYIKDEDDSFQLPGLTGCLRIGSSLDKVLVKQNHLIEAFNTTRPSLSAIDIGKYQKTYAKFTNKDKSSREYVSKRTTLA
ncbi:hypothetical protein GQX74_003930 [Glossina fuscipes]|nr:hypothetical protein GQX74_003930 [Glossina fuscipes]